jgi:predicted ATPase/class 3 adenylate cyclase
MEITSSFGYWIRRQRKALDLTQQVLAERVGCSLAAIKKIESDERRPSRQIAERLADVLGVAAGQREMFLEVARGLRSVDQLSLAREPVNPLLPSGTVTFLYTDIEGSTKLAHQTGDAWEVLRKRHHGILRQAIEAHNGHVFQVIGDAFCAAFHTAGDAVRAAVKSQVDLQAENWGEAPIRVRMGIHIGKAEVQQDGLYLGYVTLSHVQRLMSAGHGGQVLLSSTTQELVQDEMPDNVELRDMGKHRLKDFDRPEHLFQLDIAGLPSDFPPLNTLDSTRHNLPVQLTSFIGREKVIADVIHLLKKARMVTLTGPGGTGKTRLSIQVANELLDQCPDGIWFVELAPLSDPLLIPRTTAIAIGLRDEPQRPVIDMLCDFLREKKMIIILDNCEHLIEACAQFADTLLHACPQIRILASSREALGIAGETTYLVPSLALPHIQNLPPVESLSQYEAIKLFIDRATSAIPRFTLTDENASSIAQICQRLDGIPLAIELAAGKIRALSPGQIAQRLDDRFRLLTSGSRTAFPRHQTLQAAIEWSYNLLAPSEQILFRKLSVFIGGWTLEAAESVCSDKDTNTKNTPRLEGILGLLIQLINKSLITTEERNGEVRYHMLETIHQYAHEELLKSDDMTKVQTNHLDFLVKLSEEAEPKLLGKDQLIWLDRLENELANIRAALEWSVKSGHVVGGLRLAGALWRFWDVRNHWSEGRERLAALISHPETVAQTKEYTKALYAAGILAQIQDDHASAGPCFSEGLAICRNLQDNAAIGYFLLGLAHTWKRYRGNQDNQDNPRLLDESFETFTELGDRWGIALSLEGQATSALAQDDLATANSRRAESIKIYRELGDRISLSFALNGLADVMMLQGNYDQAVTLYKESLALFQEMEHRRGICYSLNALGEVARCQGDYNLAKIRYEETLVIGQEIGDKGRITAAHHNLAYVSQHKGNYTQAIILFNKSLVSAQEFDDKLVIALCLVGLAGQVQALGYPKRAANLFGAAQPLFDATSKHFARADQIEYQRNLIATHAQLDEATFASAFAEGQKMSLDEALDLALKTVEEM